MPTSVQTHKVSRLPNYFRDLDPCEVPLGFHHDGNIKTNLITAEPRPTTTNESDPPIILKLDQIRDLSSRKAQYTQLLLRRHLLTEQLVNHGLNPPLILQRARTYEALGFSDLAAADAYVVCTLCETVKSEEWVSDLEPVTLDGGPWPPRTSPDKEEAQDDDNGDSEKEVQSLLIDSLVVLYRTLVDLGATQDAEDKYDELVQAYTELHGEDAPTDEDIEARLQILTAAPFRIDGDEKTVNNGTNNKQKSKSKFGWSRREIYPWNEHEPDRNSSESIQEINNMLQEVAPQLEAKITKLPALDSDSIVPTTTNDHSETDNTGDQGRYWYQLGLFARQNIPAGGTVLHEKSLLTAIRPLDDALCDACGADLETVSREDMQQCPGEGCDITFCSKDCAEQAGEKYHKPNMSATDNDEEEIEEHDTDDDDDEDENYPPSTSPFCPATNNPLYEIGRTESTTTPEWDLYFLLVTRTIQIAETQKTHPLDLREIKYLWGDFVSNTSLPSLSSSSSSKPTTTTTTNQSNTNTLPFSLYHNITLPLQFFETLMHSLPDTARPYSPTWLAKYDFWILQTLLAKFRGVANASQSSFDGKAEMAAVHPCWCLANHSCEPNVAWSPTGVREFRVRGGKDRVREGGEDEEKDEGGKENRRGEEKESRGEDTAWEGIREGEEVWSHYTDVNLSVVERRERLMEVLGGECRCERCLVESGEN